MDADTALELVKKGASLLFLDVPQHTLLGIDTQVIVRKWDQQEERLVKISEEDEERYSQGVKNMEFDKYLGPCTLSQFGEWKMLSNYITKTTIQRIEPIGAEITIIHEPDIFVNNPKTAMEEALSEQLKNTKIQKSDDKVVKRGCYYTKIPRLIKQKGILGQDLTSLNVDKTSLLESILIKEYGGVEDLLLGEMQFAFVAFIMGQSLEAFLQWKNFVNLLFGCTEAPLHTRSNLFTKEFFLLVLEAPFVEGDLLSWTRKLKELLESSLGWVFEHDTRDDIFYEDDDEFAPVVVMLEE
ncbi:unnamed protein product [Lactuca virosa]|uniref:Uncharacterized protein n=1 Tax=Lactuca virosa TaxID=75947 RepID=A0AAU9M3W1_9ASTR|nr:unnamed protein product [Lactuca virosa]